MSKTKTASGAKSASKIKIPKQIAGVKIPKTLRDSGKAAVKLAQNPMARELLSAGLMAAAAAVAANSKARKAAMAGGREAADAVTDAAGAAAGTAGKFGAAMMDVANMAAERLLGLKDVKPDEADKIEVAETMAKAEDQPVEAQADKPVTDGAKPPRPRKPARSADPDISVQ